MIYIVREDDITSLHLSNRTINCLKRSEIFTVDDLLNYSEEKLKCIRNMGPKTIIEIQGMLSEIKNDTRKYCIIKSKDDITELLQEDINSEVVSKLNSSTLYEITSEKNSSYNYNEDMLYLTEEGEVLHDLSIDKIPLSVRAINGLKRSNISKVSQLIGITAQELLEIENMGINTVNEIIRQLNNLKYTYVQNANDIENIIFLPNSELIVELIKEYGQTEQDGYEI